MANEWSSFARREIGARLRYTGIVGAVVTSFGYVLPRGRGRVSQGHVGVRNGRVLVLGAGFIGSAIARHVTERGRPVTILNRTITTAHPAGVDVRIGDVGDPEVLADALAGVDEVVYAVGSSTPVESELDPDGEIVAVVPPLIRLLEAIRARPHLRFTFLSSGGAVYGNQKRLPVPESAHPDPIGSYGIIKLTCEQYIQMYARNFDSRMTILRVANAYGPGQTAGRGQGVVARLFEAAFSGETVPLFGVDQSVRDYIHVDDVARAVADLLELPELPLVLNVGSGIGSRLGEVLATVCRVSGREIGVRELLARPFDVAQNALDISALRSLIYFDPLDLEHGLLSAWEAQLALSQSVPPTGAMLQVSSVRSGAAGLAP